MSAPGDGIPTADEWRAAVDLQCRWAEAIDRRDWDEVRSCFSADVRSDLPRTGRSVGIEALFERQRPVIEALDLTQHFLTNHRVVSRDGGLVATCSVIARHQRTQGDAVVVFTFGGRYTDVMAMTDRGLLITERTLSVTWREGDASILM